MDLAYGTGATTPEPSLRGVPATLSQGMEAREQHQALQSSDTAIDEGAHAVGPAVAAVGGAAGGAQQPEPQQAQQPEPQPDDPRLGMFALEDMQAVWSGFMAQTLQPSVGNLDQAISGLIGHVNSSIHGANAERNQIEDEIGRMVGLINEFHRQVGQALQSRGGAAPNGSQ
ncbi:hypothetical protein Rsub_11111 [Raphidocelis subcapitata]|uniref:Uncharacterized protein n=1 Tax=Raphidocelis subcapitata TaxID=307507 RepID=A0A2V0PJB9_9CHLO|nr:hypothetical protein Rsub_11111 [Raphidocelis subcapitata]|eukprot:GBF98000.1 hypothetical protein Rsub_11111 [Raphidocelis subcapitata]